MKVTPIGKRGIVFTFDDMSTEKMLCPTNVYVINGEKHIFVCDTFLGPDSMKGVIDYISKNLDKKPIIIFNSHYDYDHHWGNCAFDAEMILSHKLCKEIIVKQGTDDLEKFKKWLRGKVEIVLPTETFEDVYEFKEEGIIFFHSPGHTEDSASCYDSKDKILFVGDNLEEPIPYIRSDIEGVKTYVETLRNYEKYSFEKLIPGHGEISSATLLENNLDYLETFPELKDSMTFEAKGEHYYHIHCHNLNTLAGEYKEAGEIKSAIEIYQKFLDIAKTYEIFHKETIQKIVARIKELKES